MYIPAKLKMFFYVIFYVRYWDTSKHWPFCSDFDEWVNLKIKEGHVPVRINDCQLSFAGRTLWNWESNICTISEFSLSESGYDSVRPNRRTQIKLYRLLHKKDQPRKLKWRNGSE